MRRLWILLLLLCPPSVFAADDPPQAHVPFTSSPPTIDGRLGSEEWRGAAVLDGFRQVEPTEGAPVSEPTRLYVMVDRHHLYLGVDYRDSDPAGIRATQIVRDANLDPDDRIEIVLDTFLDRRNAYFFQIGPGGSKGDGLIGNNGAFFEKSWDGIWRGRAVIHDEGWSAEMAIPAKTLSLKPGLDSWGFNATRHVKRKNEVTQWASPNRQTRFFQVAAAGTLHGMSVLDQGVGLDVVPFVSLQGRRDHDTDEEGSKAEPGLDLRYRVTPSLTASATVNTDFAETEVDDRVVNLTRFPVFFPEKRDFFLEDSSIFTFADLEGDFIPFFSRRIGLSAGGEPVPLLLGGKLAGRVGNWNLGVLDVVADQFGGVERKNLAVVRAARNVLAESTVGALVTLGDPATDGDNAVAGVDFNYRTRSFRGDKNFQGRVWALGSRDDPAAPEGTETDGYAYGFGVDFPNDRWAGGMAYREISEDFRADLGFVRRRGIRDLVGGFVFRPRPEGPRLDAVRRFDFGADVNVIWDLESGRVETASLFLTPFEVLLESGDRFEIEAMPTRERLFEPFEIRPGVVIPPGTYGFERFRLEAELADKRPVSGAMIWETGTFFDGRRDLYSVTTALRLVRGFEVEAEWEHNDVTLPVGDFTTHLARLRFQVDFTPRLSWSTLLQWDDTTHTVGANHRLRFILAPGRELFFVVNQGFDTRDTLAALRLHRDGGDPEGRVHATILSSPWTAQAPAFSDSDGSPRP